jgi:hypothetical protein
MATQAPEFPGDVGYFDPERFAQLVVQDCLGVVKDNIDEPGLYDYGYTEERYAADNRARTIYDEIQYHFGIRGAE